jgi:hypothetical protein
MNKSGTLLIFNHIYTKESSLKGKAQSGGLPNSDRLFYKNE